ncbi:MAG: hypothetical protein AB4040_16465 [Synechococcus sp.]
MDRFQRYGNLLKFDGTNQLQRLLPALEPDYILPDERSLSDLIGYARKLAAEIRFYTLNGQATGDWRPFLDALVDPSTGEIYDAKSLETTLNLRNDWPPHVALFVVFLKLYEFLQADLNALPRLHLQHYYEKKLSLLRREAEADEVHVIFELARNAAPTRIKVHTSLDAGKVVDDKEKRSRPSYYETQAELVVSAAKVKEFRRLVGETYRNKKHFFSSVGASELEGKSWYTFGRKQLDLDANQRFMSEAQIGFAIASPILLMAEGARKLTVRIDLSGSTAIGPSTLGLVSAFTVDLTGVEGWLTPNSFTALLQHQPNSDLATLTIELSLDQTAPPIVAFDSTLHGDGAPAVSWPVLRCRLNGAAGHYETLDGLTIEHLTLDVDVKGVKQLIVQNEQGLLTPEQPMALFGSQPRLGSSFYIGSAEVFSKHLNNLKLILEWQDVPKDLYAYYRAYFDSSDSQLTDTFSSYFVAKVDLLYDHSWDHSLLSFQSLFNSNDDLARDRRVIEANDSAFRSALADTDDSPKPELRELGAYKADTKYGFIRLSLTGPSFGLPYVRQTTFEAFGHQMFPKRYGTQAIALSQNQNVELPNPPWTPTLASLSLDYCASVDIVPGTAHSENQFFRLEPFGYSPASAQGSRLIPNLTDADANNLPFALGALYLGLENFTPPDNISLLFQIDRGTASATPVLAPTATEWSYLSREGWKRLPRNAILNDSTYGFQQPGLVVLSVARDATTVHTIMPAGMVWLRALVRQAPESAARTHALHSQAAIARFSPTAGELSSYNTHLQQGIAEHTIKRLKQRDAAIKSVSQPYRSYGGRASETDKAFFRRCSERLRHRNRAVTPWDFERLVLEQFPEVFKVKCLPHSTTDGTEKAGEAALVIVPNLRTVTIGNRLEPRPGEVLMNRIRDYINSGIASAFANVNVIPPAYEHILVDAQVAFQSGLDAGFYAGVLNQELSHFLSPWAYEDGRDITFGAQIYKSEILAFMEGRDYVDYITDFQLYHSHDGAPRGGIDDMTVGVDFIIRPDPQPTISHAQPGMVIGDTFVVGRGVEVAITTRPHSILVSHPEHRITPISIGEGRCSGPKKVGIGYMTVALDFTI